MKRTIKDIHVLDNPIIVAGAELFPLFQAWKERYGAEESTYTYKPLTEATMWDDRIASGDAPASYSEVLDAVDRMNNNGWITLPCWKIEKSHPQYEQAKSESLIILNTYMSGSAKARAAWAKRVTDRGYAPDLVAEALAYEEEN